MKTSSAISPLVASVYIIATSSLIVACGGSNEEAAHAHGKTTPKAEQIAQVTEDNRIKALDNHHEHDHRPSQSGQRTNLPDRVQIPAAPLYAQRFDGVYRALAQSQQKSQHAQTPATFVGSPPASHHGNECVLDFATPNLMQYHPGGTTYWADRSFIPWLRDCGQNSRLDLRYSKYGHLHFGFENFDFTFCGTDPDFTPAYVDEDGNCELLDINTLARSYATSHGWDEVMILRANYKYSSDWTPFDLKRIRIVREQGARVCYRKANEPDSDGPWIIADGHGTGTTPSTAGGWYCWPHLGQGTWDVSAWADNVERVKITGSIFTCESIEWLY